VFSWLRGPQRSAPLGSTAAQETEVGFAGAGEIAMEEAGAGLSGDLADDVLETSTSGGSA
jgi:hypothetical protein